MGSHLGFLSLSGTCELCPQNHTPPQLCQPAPGPSQNAAGCADPPLPLTKVLWRGGGEAWCRGAYVEGKGQLTRVGSLLPLCGSWEPKSVHQEPAQSFSFFFFTVDAKT